MKLPNYPDPISNSDMKGEHTPEPTEKDESLVVSTAKAFFWMAFVLVVIFGCIFVAMGIANKSFAAEGNCKWVQATPSECARFKKDNPTVIIDCKNVVAKDCSIASSRSSSARCARVRESARRCMQANMTMNNIARTLGIPNNTNRDCAQMVMDHGC